MIIKVKQIPKWYAVAVYSRQEKAAAKEIYRKGFQVYLPISTKRRMWSDRVKNVEVALFPGYIFVHAELTAVSRREIIFPKQVWDFVGRRRDSENGIALAVPSHEIESLKILIENSKKYEPVSELKKGSPVKIVQGPFSGAIGYVDKAPKGLKNVTVQIPLLGRGVRTTIGIDDVLAFSELTKSQLPKYSLDTAT